MSISILPLVSLELMKMYGSMMAWPPEALDKFARKRNDEKQGKSINNGSLHQSLTFIIHYA
jgi:hypothetical protein